MLSQETYKIRGNVREMELGKVGDICECGGIWLQGCVSAKISHSVQLSMIKLVDIV